MLNDYIPKPEDLSDVELPQCLDELTEKMSRNVHEVWAKSRMSQGWKFGEKRDDESKTHPCLVEYEKLSEQEKNYDRATATETLKYILKSGFEIKKGEPDVCTEEENAKKAKFRLEEAKSDHEYLKIKGQSYKITHIPELRVRLEDIDSIESSIFTKIKSRIINSYHWHVGVCGVIYVLMTLGIVFFYCNKIGDLVDSEVLLVYSAVILLIWIIVTYLFWKVYTSISSSMQQNMKSYFGQLKVLNDKKIEEFNK